jgi:hypothetical protein
MEFYLPTLVVHQMDNTGFHMKGLREPAVLFTVLQIKILNF